MIFYPFLCEIFILSLFTHSPPDQKILSQTNEQYHLHFSYPVSKELVTPVVVFLQNLHIYRITTFLLFFPLVLQELLPLRARLSACDQEPYAISHNGVDSDFYSRAKSLIKHMILKSHTMHKNPGIILSGCCVMVRPASAIPSLKGFVCVKRFVMFEFRPVDSLRESCSVGL